jgi:hypothetical protein
MDKPDKITTEDQRKIWNQFELQVQGFRTTKEQRDSEFKAELERLKTRLRKLDK